MAEARQLLALTAGGRRYGIPARSVREVARLPRLTRVPHAPPAMIGLANVRGVVTPVHSLAALAGRAAGTERRLVVLAAADPVAIAVDTVAELIDARAIEAAAIEAIDALALTAQRSGDSKRVRAPAGVGPETAAVDARAGVVLVAFSIGRQSFALPLDAIEEVMRLPGDIAAMPHGPAMVLGSVEARGALLPVLRLADLLALPGAGVSARTRILVVRIGAHRVGLLVDAVQGIVRVAEAEIDPVPVVLTRGDAEARVQAICRLGRGRLLSVLAPDHLLREDLTASLLQGGSADRPEIASADADEIASFVIFVVGDAAYALPGHAVDQIVALPARLTRLPSMPGFVRGVMSFRRAAIPVIDQAARFGAVGAEGKPRVIIVRIGALVAGFLVDKVAAIRRVSRSALQPAPEIGNDAMRIFDTVVAGDEAPILVLGPDEMLRAAERDLLRAASKELQATA